MENFTKAELENAAADTYDDVITKVEEAKAKGRVSSYMTPLCGDGDTLEKALESLLERLPIYAKVLL